MYLERSVRPRRRVDHLPRVGGRLAPHATGVGVVCWRTPPSTCRRRSWPGRCAGSRPVPRPRPSELRRILADVRRDGYAITDGTVETVALSVAAPVRGPDDTVVAAISVVVPAESAQPREIVPAVVAAARGISGYWARRAASGWRALAVARPTAGPPM
ncbi:IclR family transcriptional regulator domain-containing protein [Kutzneria kofuensis]|uniref:IclR family transcriptional regulator domain-containing protein n=1 Tax=Kutzneria kofuensis TaxID=103725 RepID=UPI003CD06FA7